MKFSRLGPAAAVAFVVTIAAWSTVASSQAPARGAAPAQTRGAAAGPQVPRLEVDPLWPQPFPVEKHWALGSVTGTAVDSQDHIWVTHRGVDSLQTNEKGPTLATWAAECCYAAPQVMELDVFGKVIDSWGGPGLGSKWRRYTTVIG